MFSRIDHMSQNKTSLNKFMKIEIISTIFSDHTGMKLEINYNKKTETHTNTWKLNNMLLNNECFNNEIKGKIRRYFATNENENTTTQTRWDTRKAVLIGKFIELQFYLKRQEKA